MRLRAEEDRLQRYIDFRSQHLMQLCVATFMLVLAAAFYLLWDSHSLYPLQTHFGVIKKIISGPKTAVDYFHVLQAKGLIWPIGWRILVAFSSGLLAAVLIALPWMKRPDRMTWLYLKEGSEVYEHAKAGVRVLKKRIGIWKKRGIQIYHGVGGRFNLPYELETKHIIYLGSVGSGKTASMLHAIQSIVERGDKAVIYDYKGDMTQWLAGREDVSLIAFADTRSDPWHIAKDIHSPLLARELAQTIIKETCEPVWSDNSRDVLAGCLEYFITTKPQTWGFQDISDFMKQDRQLVAEKLKRIGHGAANTIDKPKDDKGANSVMSTVRSGAWIFDVLAQAWGNPCKGFSVRGWLHDEQPEKRIIILRNYPDISAVSNWVLSIILNQLFGEVLSLKDSNQRRIWAVIDELATLPKIPRLEECLVASRSKGFRFLCGIQNFSSMREKYGANIAQTIFSQFATRIFCRVSDGETAKTLAEGMGGERRVCRAEVKRIKALNDEGKPIMKWDVQWHEKVEPTVLNSAIMNLPDPTESGNVMAWLYIAGLPICKLQWDFLKIEATAPIDMPVAWMSEVKKAQHVQEEVKPIPKPSRPTADDFDDLDDIDVDDFTDFEDDV